MPSKIEEKKMSGQDPSAKTLLKQIQSELKNTVGYDGESRFESDFNIVKGKRVEKLMSPRKVFSLMAAGFDKAKRGIKGEESRKSLLIREKKVKRLVKGYRNKYSMPSVTSLNFERTNGRGEMIKEELE